MRIRGIVNDFAVLEYVTPRFMVKYLKWALFQPKIIVTASSLIEAIILP